MDKQVGEVAAALEGLARRLVPEALAGAGEPAGSRGRSFEAMYATPPPWDIGRPQPAFLELAEANAVRGRVLDVGCGTGEHALMAAGLGLPATGVDTAPTALARAEGKARDRGLAARFLLWDALDLAGLGEQFDTVLDCGLFHVLSDEERGRFVSGLRAVTTLRSRYFMLCFSDRQPGEQGPRRVTEEEIRASFADGWEVDAIEAVTLDVTGEPDGVQGWRASLTRTG